MLEQYTNAARGRGAASTAQSLRGRARRRALASGAILSAVAVAACGSTEYVVDGGKLQRSITKALTGDGLSVKSVKCPGGTQIKKGLTVKCTVALTNGEVEPYAAVFATAKGLFHARPVDEIATFVERTLDQRLAANGVHAAATCPRRVPIVVGNSFTCSLKATNGQTATVPLTFTDVTGGFRIGQVKTG
jgi:hypothetical protein